MDRKRKNCPDSFCYIYGNVVVPTRQVEIPYFMKKVYRDYFGIKLEDQIKPFAPHVCYETCGELDGLKEW